jgi:hypothetical protein
MGTVTLELSEYENLKKELLCLKQEVNNLNEQKNFKVVIDLDIYNWRDDDKRENGYRVLSYGSLEQVTNNTYTEVRNMISEHVDVSIKKSKMYRFYNKFPKWFIKLLGCE